VEGAGGRLERGVEGPEGLEGAGGGWRGWREEWGGAGGAGGRLECRGPREAGGSRGRQEEARRTWRWVNFWREI
jgi:hypothetical protein